MDNQIGTLSSSEDKIDAETLRKHFFFHSVAGFVIIIGLRFFNAPVMLAIALVAAVLCNYFYRFKKGGEPQALIDTFADSAYYLGFLLTLVSLIIAMIFFDLSDGALSASYILTQFGAAMTTTLLGMSFRIWYKQFDTNIVAAQISVREALDQTVRDFNIQMRSTNNTLSRLTKTIDKNIEDTELRNEKSLQLYDDTQKKIIELSEVSINLFTANIEKNLNNSISKLNDFLGTTSQAMDKVVTNSLASNNIVAKQNSELLKDGLEELFGKMTSDFADTFKIISSSTENLNSAFDGASNSAKGLDKTISETAKAASIQLSQFESLQPNFKAIEASQNEFVRGLDKLSIGIKEKVETLSEFDSEIGKHVADMVNEYKKLLVDFKNIAAGTGMQNISAEEESLINALQDRRQSLEKLSTQWNTDVEDMSRNSRLFAENLIKTSQFIARELGTSESQPEEQVS
jgi:hypothetical protein